MHKFKAPHTQTHMHTYTNPYYTVHQHIPTYTHFQTHTSFWDGSSQKVGNAKLKSWKSSSVSRGLLMISLIMPTLNIHCSTWSWEGRIISNRWGWWWEGGSACLLCTRMGPHATPPKPADELLTKHSQLASKSNHCIIRMGVWGVVGFLVAEGVKQRWIQLVQRVALMFLWDN